MTESKNSSEKDFGIWSVERRIKLTKQIAYLSCAVCIFYIIFDFYSGAYEYLLYYLILLFGGGSCLILLRYGKVTLAKTFLLISGVILLGIFASWETAETGLFMYFLVVGVTAFTIFGTEEKISAILIGLFSIIVFYLVYFTDTLSFEKVNLSESYIATSFFINFCICLMALMTVVYHIMSLSVKYERKMLKSQGEMMRLTSDLRESQSRFELAIRGSSVGIWDWDVTNDHLFISPLLVELLNYPKEKYENMTSDKINRVVHPEDQPGVKEALKYHLEKRKKYYKECRLRKGDNSYIWVLISGQAQWDDSGEPIRMVGTIVNIDELKEAFERLEEQNELLEKANEELDRFVYSTSHDLRAPLTSILGLLNLAEKSENINEIQNYLTMIEGRTQAMTTFIAEIIDYSRNSRLEVVKDKIVFYELIDEVVQGLKYFEKSDRISFEVNIPRSLTLFSDRGRLKIIMNNLIANAVKYHDLEKSKPIIRINAELMAKDVIISIKDNGLGIQPEFQDKIFNMFFRATEKSQGSGLGLYIAKEMATKLSGTIRLESEPGKGSIFYLEIPFEEVLEDSVV